MHNIMVVSPLDHHPNRSKSFLIPVVPTCGFPKSDVLIVGIPTLGHQKRNTIISNRHRIKRMGKILKSCMGPVVFRDTLVKMMVGGYQERGRNIILLFNAHSPPILSRFFSIL